MGFSAKTVFVALADRPEADLVGFYQQLFGDPVLSVPSVYSEFALSGLRLGIFQPEAGHQAEFAGEAGSISLCIEVPDLETAITELTRLNCRMSAAITVASHGREIYAYDPAGNRLIVHESASEAISVQQNPPI